MSDDLQPPRSPEEAFDFKTKVIHDWEVVKIRRALKLEEIVLEGHALQKASREGLDYDDLAYVVKHGRSVSKDLPENELGRWEGINFDGKVPSKNRRVCVKVGWRLGFYEYGTAYFSDKNPKRRRKRK